MGRSDPLLWAQPRHLEGEHVDKSMDLRDVMEIAKKKCEQAIDEGDTDM